MKTIILIILLSLSAINAQWKQCNGPFGASFKDIEVFENNLYIGTESNGIFFSSDNGDNWQPYNNGLSQFNIACISNIDDNLYISVEGSGIFKLEGDEWKSTSDGLNFSNISTIVGTGDTIFAGDYFNHYMGISIAYSTDGGLNWDEMPFSEDYNLRYIYEMLYYNNKLWVQSNNSLAYTSDLGENWYLTEEISSDLSRIAHINVIGDNIFLTDRSKLYYTSDLGDSWEELYFLDNDEITSMSVGENFIYIGTKEGHLYLYDLINKSFTEIANDFQFNQIRSIIENDGILFIGEYSNSGRLLMSNDKGNNFVERMKGIAGDIYTSDMIGLGYKNFAAVDNSIYLTENNGVSWNKLFSTPDNENINEIVISNNIYAVTESVIFKSELNIIDFKKMSTLPDSITTINSLSASQDSIVIATDNGIFTSIDLGKNWDLKNSGIPTSKQVYKILYKNGTILVSFKDLGIYLSTDFGNSWDHDIKGLDDLNISSISISEDYNYIGNKDGIFRKEKTWEKWTQAGELTGEVNDIIIDGNYIFTATESGYFFSENNGNSWSDISEGLPDQPIKISSNDNFLFASTNNNGIYSVEKEYFGITGVKENKQQNLISISPNPAEDYIDVFIDGAHLEDDHHRIEIYDVLGNKVFNSTPSLLRNATPCSHPDLSGQEGNLKIDVSQLPKGVYFVRIGDITEKFVKM